jgi:hypothetical protein
VAQEVAEGGLCEADEVVLEVLQEEEEASALVEEVAEASQGVAVVASLQEEEEAREVDLLVDVVDTVPPTHSFRCHGVFGFLCRVCNCHWRLLGFNQKARSFGHLGQCQSWTPVIMNFATKARPRLKFHFLTKAAGLWSPDSILQVENDWQ